VSCDPTAITSKAAPTSAATSSRSGTRIDQEREQRARQAQLVNQGRIQDSRTDLEQPGGEGVGTLADLLTCKPESQQIRDHQHPGRFIDDTGFLINNKLVDRINGWNCRPFVA
jgi:hypothetical protein